MNTQVTDRDDNEKLSISLPLRKRDLGSFISNLLGQQQSFQRLMTTQFDIDHDWLINLHELLHQRIKQQSDSTLIEFVAQIHFESGLKRTITTADSFNAYVETKKESVVAITLLWSYLVQFPERAFPDKQEITFHARIRRNEQSKQERKTSPIIHYIVESILAESERSFMTYSISHTERTWGDDIEALIANHMEKVIRDEMGFTKKIYNILRWTLAIGVFFFLMLYPMYHLTSNTASIISELSAQYQVLDADPQSIALLSKKLDITAKMVEAIGIKDRAAYLAAMIFLAPFLAPFLLKVSRKNLHSFIVLSKHDKSKREKLLKKENNSIKITIASYIFAILAGILGNYGYSWLTTNTTEKQEHSAENISKKS
ncbi:hypothetical protein [Pseudomonas viridiflava]|uniref:hypothetical protein n=1 Tax=Pseudomonas viridiflava TaxID=33069 RepID=UPI000F06B854|nr:hypothetical protein [Pseudomonas viridiflava]